MKFLSVFCLMAVLAVVPARAKELRIGLIGLDTSHVIAFTKLLNDPADPNHVAGAKVTAAFQGGSLDIASSRSRVENYTRELREKYGVKLCPTIQELCDQVDAVMLESVDGRPHLAQAIPVLLAGKPLFIDKPMAASLADVLAIFSLAKQHQVPVFSSSSLRYGRTTQAVRKGAIGRVLRAETTSPCALEPSHPDLYWYGIHGVESLFTVLGTGCRQVSRTNTPEGLIEVRGEWKGGRQGVYRESKSYGGEAVGEEGKSPVGAYDGYAPLLVEVIKFFQTGVSPVSPEETIELFAFMSAADESKRRGGAWVSLEEMLRQAGHPDALTKATCEVRKIWDAAPHNAFTDLIRFSNQWFCVFREGQGHVSPDGSIRVLVSPDGRDWKSAARIQSEEGDLRDPKITVTPDGRLMLLAACAQRQTPSVRHLSYAWFSPDGRSWGEPIPIGETNMWLWRATWKEETAYGIGYNTRGENFVRLYRSPDGRRWETVVANLFAQGQPNESSIVFRPDGTAVCLLRRDGSPGSGQVGLSKAPYTEWEWRDLGVKIGGPHLLELPDGRLVAGVRLYDGKTRTALAWLDPEKGELREFLTLPSAGDTSYPGLAWHGDRLWVSYYSSHEGKTSIYLAEVDLKLEETAWRKIESLFQPPQAFKNDFGRFRSPLQFENGEKVKSSADWSRRRQEIFEFWQGHLGKWPPLLEKPDLEILRTEARQDLTQHRVRAQIAQNEAVEGWLLVPRGQGPFPAVVVPFYEPETSVGLKPGSLLRDFAYQLARRGFVTLSIGSPGGDARKPEPGQPEWQPLSYLAYVAANCHTMLARRPEVDPERIGIVGHSYGGKWAMFAAALHEKFAWAAVSDPGIVFDETRPNVNYWEPWYLGRDSNRTRRPGVVTDQNPRTGAYQVFYESGHDLTDILALIAPRPFFVSGGSEDPPERWRALNHLAAINSVLGYENRVGMSNRPGHSPTEESNEQLYAFFVHLK